MGRTQLAEFRRRLMTVEETLFLGTPASEMEIRHELDVPGADGVHARIEDAASLAAGRLSHLEYRARHGASGVRRFQSVDGTVIFGVPVETFPTLVNNLYFIDSGTTVTLVDAGSPLSSTSEDLARGARILSAVWDASGLYERVRDVVITHGHIDHFGGVARWKKLGAKIHVHVLDVRVVARFEERVVVAAMALRTFLERAGVAPSRRVEIEQMYVFSKHLFRSVAVDGRLEDSSRVGPCVIYHTPGHCPGHCCVQVDNVLMTGDHVLPDITPHQSPETITPWTGLGHYIEALERVRRILGIDLALPGHGDPMSAMVERIAEIKAFHHQRLAKVLDLCRDGQTLAELTDTMFPGQIGYGVLLALEEAGAHVEYLAERGQLEIANVEDFTREANPVARYRAS